MRKRTSNKTLLIGGVAALVVLGGGGLWLATQRNDPAATPAAEGEPGHAEGEAGHAEGEAGHAEEGEAPEGRVELTAAQIQAAGITVVSVGGGGAEKPVSPVGSSRWWIPARPSPQRSAVGSSASSWRPARASAPVSRSSAS